MSERELRPSRVVLSAVAAGHGLAFRSPCSGGYAFAFTGRIVDIGTVGNRNAWPPEESARAQIKNKKQKKVCSWAGSAKYGLSYFAGK